MASCRGFIMKLINKLLVIAFCICMITPAFIVIIIFSELTITNKERRDAFQKLNFKTFKEFWYYKNFVERR